MISLCWWEYEQLLDHLRERKDIWSTPREYMWMRQFSSTDDTLTLGLAFSAPVKSGPYRQYGVKAVPFSWSVEDCDSYLKSLCRKWTDYGTRIKFASFLHLEAGLDLSKANACAIGLAGVEQLGERDPEITPVPTQRELWPDVNGPDISNHYRENTLRTYGFTGGGWLSVRLQGGMLRVRASLQSDGEYGGGYSGSFEGFIRPSNGNVPLAAAFLYGRVDGCHGETDHANPGETLAGFEDSYTWAGLSRDAPKGKLIITGEEVLNGSAADNVLDQSGSGERSPETNGPSDPPEPE